MSKRFVDTDRYRKALRGLDCKTRLAHEWLWQNCDHAGVWATDLDLFKFECGYSLNIEALLKACPWVRQLANGSLFITDYIDVNCGKLKEGYNPHKPVFRSLEANGIDPFTLQFQDLPNPCPRVVDEEEDIDNTQGRKERARKKPEPAPHPFDSPEYLAAFEAFDQMRIAKRKPMTDRARQLILADLSKMGEADAILSLNTSTRSGWTDVYPPKKTIQFNGQQTDEERRAERNRIIAERYAGQ